MVFGLTVGRASDTHGPWYEYLTADAFSRRTSARWRASRWQRLAARMTPLPSGRESLRIAAAAPALLLSGGASREEIATVFRASGGYGQP